MRKTISFSLWGASPKYCIGAIKNVKLAKILYPDFVCRFYCDYGVPISVISDLEDLGSEIISVNQFGNFEGMFWRFWALEDSDIVLVRDADSRLSAREVTLVDEWLSSDKQVHSIHDHPWHRASFMPGLSGFKRNAITEIRKKITQFLDNREESSDHYGIDYEFFHEMLVNGLQNNLLLHDSVFDRGVRIQLPRIGLEFCGRVFDENDVTVHEHDQILKNWLAHS